MFCVPQQRTPDGRTFAGREVFFVTRVSRQKTDSNSFAAVRRNSARRKEVESLIPTYEQMGDWLEEIAAEFPEAFFEELDGGIQLEEKALPDPAFPEGEMYIMGEYVHDFLGRYILLYYGSFAALLAEEDEEVWKDEIFITVAHEFTHHLEETAGLHALDDADAEFLRQALEEYQ